MCSHLKILFCIAMVCATTVSTTKRTKRSDWQTGLPYQSQPTNNWGLSKAFNDVQTPTFDTLGIDVYNQNLNGRDGGNSQLGNAVQSSRGYNSQKSSIEDTIGPSSFREKSRRTLPNERNELESSPAEDSGRSPGRLYEQRQSQSSDRLSNQQNIQGLGVNSIRSGQIPLLRNRFINDIQDQGPRILIESSNPSKYGGLSGQRTSNFNPGRVDGFSQNTLGRKRYIGETIQSNPSGTSASQRDQSNNGIDSEFLNGERTAQISRGSRGEQEIGTNSLKNDYTVFSPQDIPSEGNPEYFLQPQIGRYSNQFGINQFRDFQRELEGNRRGQVLYAGVNGRRLPSTRVNSRNNVALLQEAVPEARPELRANSESNLNSFQPQRNINQVSVSQQQQPNIYSYGELSAKILKVIQSNPAMLSNMNGFMEQLKNNEGSGNEQIRQLQSLLQQIGKYNSNPSSSGINIDGQRQQKPLIRNLQEGMDRRANNQIESNIPNSYLSFSS